MDRGPMMFTSDVSLPKDVKTTMRGKQITAGQLTGLKTHRDANYATKKGRGSKAWAVRQNKKIGIHLHLLLIIHLEISIQNISLVLSCEPHPKCKPKATNNYIKRTLHKVNNPCNRGYKHRCFPPCGNITSPRLMCLSLKLVIRGHEPTIKQNAPSWSYYLLLGQSNRQQWSTCKNYSRKKNKREEP